MSKNNKKSVVTPIIKIEGHTNVLEDMIKGSDAPTLKSVGYARVGEGSNNWVSYVITTRGTEVIEIQVDEPNMREVAEESSKINFVQEFMAAEIL